MVLMFHIVLDVFSMQRAELEACLAALPTLLAAPMPQDRVARLRERCAHLGEPADVERQLQEVRRGGGGPCTVSDVF